MTKFKQIIALVVCVTGLGCATIFSGSSDTVNIASEPAGGKVYVNGNFMGNSPTSLNLKRDKDYNVMIKKDGFEPGTATITRSFNAVSILNLTSPLCWVVDVVTGAMWKFDQNAVNVNLEKSTKAGLLHMGRAVAGAHMKAVPFQGKTAIYWESPAHASR